MRVSLEHHDSGWAASVKRTREFGDFAVEVTAAPGHDHSQIRCEGVRVDHDEAWVRASWLANAADCRQGEAATRFQEMLDYAQSRRWYDQARDEIAAHVVNREP